MAAEQWLRVGFLLYDGFEVLDLYGPMEMFGLLVHEGKLQAPGLLTVAERAGPVASAQGPATLAEYDFGSCPPLDVLIVPGGAGARREVDNPALLEFLRRVHPGDAANHPGAGPPPALFSHILSVCTGAALLAKAGLLDGLPATTNKRSFGWVASTGPATRWIKDARWVNSSAKITTAAGVSAGMDGALSLIQRVFGAECAAGVARRAEYAGDYDDESNDPFGKLYREMVTSVT